MFSLLWAHITSSEKLSPALGQPSPLCVLTAVALFSVNKALFSQLFCPLEWTPWRQELSFDCFCNSACGIAPGIVNVLSTYLRDEDMHPHNYRLVYFNNIATENIHTKFKTTKGPIRCPARSHSENNNHINPSDFLIAGQPFSGRGGFCLSIVGPYVGIGSEIWRTLWHSQLYCVPQNELLSMSDN